MKILVISNYYPPHFIGGYELACRNIVEALKSRGHEVKVLTSTYGVSGEKIEKNVYRKLRIHCYGKPHNGAIIYSEIVNQKYFKRLCADFVPDLIFVWNAANISISLIFLAKKMGLPICYYVFDNWLATWEMDYWHQLWRHKNRFEKFLLKGFCLFFNLVEPHDTLDLSSAIFASHYLKDLAAHVGKEVRQAPVVHWGIDHRRFAMKKGVRRIPQNLLYVGQIVSQKGVHTAIQALDILVNKFNCDSLNLTIVGDTSFMADYVSYLQALARRARIEEKICFRGKINSDDIAEIYAGHDILIFPSVWDEPFGITPLEAMASGLAVVGSATGGSSEILKNCLNSLTFSRGDSTHCAEQILRLIREPELYRKICETGRGTVESEFTFDRVVNILEEKLIGFTRSKSDAKCTLVYRRSGQDSDSRDNKKAEREYSNGMITLFHKVLSTVILIVVYFVITITKNIHALLLGKGGYEPAIHQNILVVQLGETDTAVLTMPLLSAIRRGRPSDKIILIVQPSVDNLLKMSSYADRTLFFDLKRIRNWKQATRGHFLWWFMATVLKLKLSRMCAVHTAISLHHTNDSYQAASAAIVHLSGASQVFGYRDTGDTFTSRILNHFIVHGPIRKRFENELDRCSHLLKYLGISGIDPESDMGRHFDHNEFSFSLLSTSAACKTPIIAIACGGEFHLRRWPIERFIEVGNWLQTDYGARIVIIGDESDKDVADFCCNALRRNHNINYVHSVNNFIDAVRLLKYCTLFLGNDTWQLYAAAAIGTPVIGLFGPGDPSRLGHEGVEKEVIRLDLLCSPCKDKCMFERPYCMEGLQVGRIKAALAIKLRNHKEQNNEAL